MQIAYLPTALESISPTTSLERALKSLAQVRDVALFVQGGEWFTEVGGRIVQWVAGATAGRQQLDRYVKASETVLAALREGEMVAYVPTDRLDVCLAIPRFYWLRIEAVDLSKPFARFDALGFREELVGSPIILSEEALSRWSASVDVSAWVEPAPPQVTGDPGRPTKSRELYLAEFRRRAEAGAVLPTLAAEARALREWLQVNHPKAALPEAVTISNRLRRAYNLHKNAHKMK